jgi:tetratricopeptide (TPR) repeat protein
MLLQQRSVEAAQQAKKALALSRSLPMAHFILGELALQEDNIPRAIQEFDAERQINPNYAPAYDRLEECYLRTDKLEEAQQALIRAIALDRSDTDAFIKMGKVLLSKHDVQTAIMYLKIAEKMVPNDFTPHVLLARAYHLPGQEGDARREADLAEQDHAAGQTPLQPAK